MPRRVKLALHWKILIALVLGVAVGLVISLSWGRYTWGALGVGDAANFRAGKAGLRAEVAPPEAGPALRWLDEAAKAYAPAPGAGPIEAPRNAYTAYVADWVVRGLVPESASEPSRQARPASKKTETRENLPPPDGADVPGALAWLRERTEAMASSADAPAALVAPENEALRSGLAWLLHDLARPDPNEEAGFVATAPRFLARLAWFTGELFLRLLKFIAVPVVLCSLVVGASTMTDVRKLGRVGGTTLGIYIATTAVAIVIGLVLVNVIQPGSFVSETVRDQLAAERMTDSTTRVKDAVKPDAWAVLLAIVPENPFAAIASPKFEILQVVTFALLLGLALGMLAGGKGKAAIDVFDALNEALLKIVTWVMALAPIAVFALIAQTIASTGLGAFAALGAYVGCVVGGLALLLFIEYPLMLRVFARIGVRRFFRAVAPAQLTAFSTSSSNATLPVSLRCAEERLGVPKNLASFVLPLGATINMDGTALYQAVAAVFICQLYGVDLSSSEQLMILLTATLASIGTPGVPGVGLIMIIVILEQLGVASATTAGGIAVILGVDRILDMCRTTLNVSGDLMTACIVARREGVLPAEPPETETGSGG